VSDCVFCKIASGEIPAPKLIDDPEVVAFRDLNPQAPDHILIIPRQHIGIIGQAGKCRESLGKGT
jgi:histidine triad (HIT) family protein